MINTEKLPSSNLQEALDSFETHFIEELEQMVVSRLFEIKTIHIPGTKNDTVEFAGRTNFKIRLKRPNKNVWSIPLQSIRDSIKKVLREGEIGPIETPAKEPTKSNSLEMPLSLLLHTLPDEEYHARSFVGNAVIHPTLGEGRVSRISETGNVEVDFKDRHVMIKPGFVSLKTT